MAPQDCVFSCAETKTRPRFDKKHPHGTMVPHGPLVPYGSWSSFSSLSESELGDGKESSGCLVQNKGRQGDS